MFKAEKIKNDLFWVGALDPDLRIFDIIMYTPFGSSYNSYVIKGSKKTALIETVKEKFFDEYLERLKTLDIDISKIDYIIVNHTEPDHSGSISKMLKLAPNAKIVATSAAIGFLKEICNSNIPSIVASHGFTLDLGNKTLKFISAPFLHWPDSMYTYLVEDKVLYTCDSFGSHYCEENVFDDLIKNEDDYLEATKYYYDMIFGPFKKYIIEALDKIKDLDIEIVCPGHGPVLRKNFMKIRDLYAQWSSPKETKDTKLIVIPYVTAYGYTEKLANSIAEGINSLNENIQVKLYNILNFKKEEILKELDDCDGMIFGSPTINSDALLPIMDILTNLNPIIHGGKFAASFGSFGWSGEATKNIESRLKELKLKVPQSSLKVRFNPSDDQLKDAFEFGKSFASSMLKKETPKENLSQRKMKNWKCLICGIIIESVDVPESCPVCGAGKEQFIEVPKEEEIKHHDTGEKILIIGNGVAGFTASKTIRERNKTCDITIISKESENSYYRTLLSDMLTNYLTDDEFYLAEEDYYKENNILVYLNDEVILVDVVNKNVLLKSQKKLFYDKLIFANGANNFIPPINNIALNGVFTLRNADDVIKIKKSMKESKKAVVIGGGLLGLETAHELLSTNIDTTVIECMPRLLPKQLDEEGADIFLKTISKSGLKIELDSTIVEILGDDHVTGIKLKSGKVIECDFVLVSVGISPDISLAKSIKLSTNKGIIVNEKMQTNIKNIYAIGDVAEINGMVYGNWPAGLEMANVAAKTICEEDVSFKGFISSVIFDSLGAKLFSCGNIDEQLDQIVIKYPEKGIYKKIFYKDNIISGAMLLGDVSSSGKIMMAIESAKSKSAIDELNVF